MVVCSCNRRAVIRTCWNTTNPGRRFYACPRQATTCPFIGWYDPPIQRRARDVIIYLQRTIYRNEAALQEYEAALVSLTMEAVNAGDRANELEAAYQATLADLLVEKEKVCRLRNFCVLSWMVIFLVFLWFFYWV